MPEGAAPPGASAQPTVVPASAAPAPDGPNPVAMGLGQWSGSGSVDAVDHQSFWPGDLNIFKVASWTTYFAGERVSIQNGTGSRLLVSMSGPPSLAPNGYDFIVPAFSVLTAKIKPSKQIWLIPVDAGELGNAETVEVYLMAGTFAAIGPAYEITPIGLAGGGGSGGAGALKVATAAASLLVGHTQATLSGWSTGADPFAGVDTFTLINAVGSMTQDPNGDFGVGIGFLVMPTFANPAGLAWPVWNSEPGSQNFALNQGPPMVGPVGNPAAGASVLETLVELLGTTPPATAPVEFFFTFIYE